MYKFKQIFVMDLMNLLTNPMWIFYATGFPIILILILGFLMSGTYGHTVTSYDYYGVALLVFGIFNAATFSANSFMEERIKSPNMRIVYSPVRPLFIPLSKIVATTVFCTVIYTVVALFLHLLVGVNYGGSEAWAGFLIMFLSVFFFSALGVLLCCLLKTEGITNQILSLLFALFSVLGGVFFPVDGFGAAVAAASWISPAKWILALGFQVIYDQNFSMLLPVCAGLVLLSALLIFLCSRLFRGEEYV